MEPLPPTWQHLFDELQAQRADQAVQLEEQGRQLAKQSQQLSSLISRLDTLSKMLRRREEQNARLERENRRLRRELGLDEPEPDPEPDPSSPSPPPSDPPARASSSKSPGGKSPSKKRKPRRRGGRRPPPSHLPEDLEHHPVCACGACGGKVWRKDVETSRHYTAVKTHVRCRVIERERVVCVGCGAYTTAQMPPMPVQRALFDCAFLAWLVTMKFALLIPLDRIRTHLALQGVDLAMGTLVSLIQRAAELAEAIDDAHWAHLKAGLYIAFDGTGLKTLIPGQDKAWDGYLEVYTRGEVSVFRYDLTKHADGLQARLDGYTGTLVCDAESRNRAAAPNNDLAHCLAHPLRKLRDAVKSHPKRAAQGMRFIQALYDLEEQAAEANLRGDALLSFRKRRSRRVLRRLRQWLTGVVAREPPPTDPVGKVARYMLKHWEGLTRFVDDPELPLDNNESEREFQRHAKLRYASLFAGSVAGAHRWAILLGVVRTAQKCGIDVQAYLTWLFEHQGTHQDQLGRTPEQLTPMAYQGQMVERAA
jgi:transposase